MARKKAASTNEDGGGEEAEAKMLGEEGALEDLHPFIMGLLQELPAPGTYWAPERRQLWINTATSIFQMIYSDTPPPAAPPTETPQ